MTLLVLRAHDAYGRSRRWPRRSATSESRLRTPPTEDALCASRRRLGLLRVVLAACIVRVEARRVKSLSAPVELMQRAGIAVPGSQVGIGPPAALAAGQVHAVDQEPGLRCRTLDLGWPSGRVLHRLQLRSADAPDRERGGVTPLDLDFRNLCRQPLREHRPKQAFQVAALGAAEDRLQGSGLFLVRALGGGRRA